MVYFGRSKPNLYPICKLQIKDKIEMKLQWFICLICIHSMGLYGEEFLTPAHFYMTKSDDMQSYDGKRVLMRGFLFQNEAGWILSSEPNLKSCCIGSKEKASQQMSIDGVYDHSLINHIAEIEGSFINRRLENGMYALKDAKLRVKKQSNGWIYIGLMLGFVLMIFYYISRKKSIG